MPKLFLRAKVEIGIIFQTYFEGHSKMLSTVRKALVILQSDFY